MREGEGGRAQGGGGGSVSRINKREGRERGCEFVRNRDGEREGTRRGGRVREGGKGER